MERTLRDLDAFAAEAEAFTKKLEPRLDRATLLTLSGELGAGKTTFAQVMARTLGVTEHVTSPTFVLAKTYDLSNQAFTRLVHIDAYRLEGGIELSGIRFEDLMKDAGNLILLEWPEKVADGLPEADVAIALTALSEGGRSLVYA